MRGSERGGGAIHVLLIHSIFVVAFIIFFLFFTLRKVYAFWIRYKFEVISSNAYRSVVRMTQVFDLEEKFYFENVVASFMRENDLMQ